MNWDQISGNWEKMKGQLRQRWGDLTDDDLAKAEGKREELVGRIQQRYGIKREQADKEVSDWLNKLH